MVSRRVRRRRRQFSLVGGVLFLLLIYAVFISGGSKAPTHTNSNHHGTTAPKTFPKHSPLNPNWKGDGKPVTLAFGGDVHFAGAVGVRLSRDPATALGDTVAQL
ncbi:MAG TPA: hypothetical protein VGH31_06515, partial [Acidimicrobiales bacterium]